MPSIVEKYHMCTNNNCNRNMNDEKMKCSGGKEGRERERETERQS
jgi:hypothetical protein